MRSPHNPMEKEMTSGYWSVRRADALRKSREARSESIRDAHRRAAECYRQLEFWCRDARPLPSLAAEAA
jgi:hypothetical protein